MPTRTASSTNGIFVVLLIATGVAFLVWFSRAYRNLDAFDLPRRYGTGWAIGGWFVPFLNLARPKQVADDIWASVTVSKYGDPGVRGDSFLPAAWWGSVDRRRGSWASSRAATPTDPTIDEALTSNGVFLARSVLFIVAAILAVFVVRSITRAQTTAALRLPRTTAHDAWLRLRFLHGIGSRSHTTGFERTERQWDVARHKSRLHHVQHSHELRPIRFGDGKPAFDDDGF